MKNDPTTHQMVSVPREALAALLAEAGRGGETPESYLASTEVAAEAAKGRLIQKATRAAYWSRLWLLVSAVFSFVALAGGIDAQGVFNLLALGGMAVVEFQVHHELRQGRSSGLRKGWYNQCGFAAWFLIYGTWNALGAGQTLISPQVQTLIGTDGMRALAPYIPIIIFSVRFFYGTVGLAGAFGQFLLANYYRRTWRQVESPIAKGEN